MSMKESVRKLMKPQSKEEIELLYSNPNLDISDYFISELYRILTTDRRIIEFIRSNMNKNVLKKRFMEIGACYELFRKGEGLLQMLTIVNKDDMIRILKVLEEYNKIKNNATH